MSDQHETEPSQDHEKQAGYIEEGSAVVNRDQGKSARPLSQTQYSDLPERLSPEERAAWIHTLDENHRLYEAYGYIVGPRGTEFLRNCIDLLRPRPPDLDE